MQKQDKLAPLLSAFGHEVWVSFRRTNIIPAKIQTRPTSCLYNYNRIKMFLTRIPNNGIDEFINTQNYINKELIINKRTNF